MKMGFLHHTRYKEVLFVVVKFIVRKIAGGIGDVNMKKQKTMLLVTVKCCCLFTCQEAENLAGHIEGSNMPEPLPNAQLLQPPVPIQSLDTAWPLLTVAKVSPL